MTKVIYQDVQCPLYIKRYARKEFASIFCHGKGEDTHTLISNSIEEREKKITETCEYYENCSFYQKFKQKNKTNRFNSISNVL